MDGTTGIVIATIVAIGSLIFGILKIVADKSRCDRENAITQTELGIKLANIEKELIEIKKMILDTINDSKNTEREISKLDKRLLVLENKK